MTTTTKVQVALVIELGCAVICGIALFGVVILSIAGAWQVVIAGIIAAAAGGIAVYAALKRGHFLWDMSWDHWSAQHRPVVPQQVSSRLPKEIIDLHDDILAQIQTVGETAVKALQLSKAARDHLTGLDLHVRTVEEDRTALLRKADRIAKARNILDGADDDGAPIPQFLKDGPAPPVTPLSAVNLDDLASDVEGKQG